MPLRSASVMIPGGQTFILVSLFSLSHGPGWWEESRGAWVAGWGLYEFSLLFFHWGEKAQLTKDKK